MKGTEHSSSWAQREKQIMGCTDSCHHGQQIPQGQTPATTATTTAPELSHLCVQQGWPGRPSCTSPAHSPSAGPGWGLGAASSWLCLYQAPLPGSVWASPLLQRVLARPACSWAVPTVSQLPPCVKPQIALPSVRDTERVLPRGRSACPGAAWDLLRGWHLTLMTAVTHPTEPGRLQCPPRTPSILGA